MSGQIEYLPGTRAMLVYIDEHGKSRLSIVEIMKRFRDHGVVLYAIKARNRVLNLVRSQIPTLTINSNDEDGWSVGIVDVNALRPLGSPVFTIVQ